MENREIKFRAWDEYQKKMLDWIDITNPLKLTLSNLLNGLIEHLKPMQYTGLYDKNGKEACEKDLIKSINGMIGHIEYSEVHTAFIVYTYNDDIAGEWLHNYEFEIIGNIYENPELIKQTS